MTGTCKRSGGSLSPGGPTWSFGGRKRRGGGTPHAAGGMFGGSRKRTCRRGGLFNILDPNNLRIRGGGSSNFAGETNPKYGGGGFARRMIGGKRSGKRSGKRTCRRGGGQSGPSLVGNMF